MTERRTQRLTDLAVNEIVVADNVRLDLRELDDLAGSIRERGILQPLVVVPTVDGEHVELLIGHRRLAAAKLIGLKSVPVLLRQRDTDAGRVLDQLTENVHREDITPLEKALALKVLRDEGLTHAQIAQRMRRSDQWVNNHLRLLTLPECVQRGVHLGWISLTKAIDIPQRFLDRPGAVQRLEAFITHQGKNGLHLWYQGEYKYQENREYASEARAAAPGREMDDDEATAEGKRAWEAKRREQRDNQIRARAYNEAAHYLIEKHQDEFDTLYRAILDGLLAAAS